MFGTLQERNLSACPRSTCARLWPTQAGAKMVLAALVERKLCTPGLACTERPIWLWLRMKELGLRRCFGLWFHLPRGPFGYMAVGQNQWYHFGLGAPPV